MNRSDADHWDLASSVGATATMVAAARALASLQDGRLIDDPFAAPLVKAVGIDYFTQVVEGAVDPAGADDDGSAAMMIDAIAVRTRFFDDFFHDAADAGVRQVVILASGLDSRAFRMHWPAETVVYEIDQPTVVKFKSEAMAELGVPAIAHRRTVPADLRHDWPAALVEAGFDAGAPTAWSAEGLLMYLPAQAQDRLLDDITALSAPGSWFATEYRPDAGAGWVNKPSPMNQRWRAMTDLWYVDDRTPAADYLRARGWVVHSRTRPEVFADYGLRYPDSEAGEWFRNSSSVTATLGSAAG